MGGAFPFPDIRVTESSIKSVLDGISQTNSFVGATMPMRDAADTRIIKQLTNYITSSPGPTVPVPNGPNGGLLDDPNQVGGYPVLAQGTPPADTDHDGMPDVWELNKGLNPNNKIDGAQVSSNGYTNLENYLNQLAGG
jgi:pectate lyase